MPTESMGYSGFRSYQLVDALKQIVTDAENLSYELAPTIGAQETSKLVSLLAQLQKTLQDLPEVFGEVGSTETEH